MCASYNDLRYVPWPVRFLIDGVLVRVSAHDQDNISPTLSQLLKLVEEMNNWRAPIEEKLKVNVTTKPPWKRKPLPPFLPLCLYYCLNISHFWPTCGCETNPTLSNAVISVSTNADGDMSVKMVLVSLKVWHGEQ